MLKQEYRCDIPFQAILSEWKMNVYFKVILQED